MRRFLVILGAAAFLALAPLPARWVERAYSNGVYPPLQRGATSVSNLAPFVLLDVCVGLLAIILIGSGARDLWTRGGVAALVGSARRVLVVAAGAYLAFLVTWGLNYRRPPLPARLPFDTSRVTPASAARLAAAVVDRLNALHASAHAEGWPAQLAIDRELAAAVSSAMRDLGRRSDIVPARPKQSAFDWYFRRAGVPGMTVPIFLETLVASDVLPFERPAIVAHEWAHLAGLADEGEANLAGWLACVRSTPARQYSGWLGMYAEALGAVPAEERRAIGSRLAQGPRDDLAAIRARISRELSPRLSAAGWRVYDSYLKANRVEAGAASYSEVVRLALGLEVAQVY